MTNQIKISLLILLAAGAVILPGFALAEAPTVVSQGIGQITVSSAVVEGEVKSHGSYEGNVYDKSAVWFQYGQTPNYDKNTPEQTRQGIGFFSQKIEGLRACTIYHYRAVAENGSERAYGLDRTFTTKCHYAVDVQVAVKNITRGDETWYRVLNVNPLDVLMFRITVESTGVGIAEGILVKNNLPRGMIYLGDLTIGGTVDSRDITAQPVDIGNLPSGMSKTITFKVQLQDAAYFPSQGQQMINTAIAYTQDMSDTNSCTLRVWGGGVVQAGAVTQINGGGVPSGNIPSTPTAVKTGITTDVLGSVLLPLTCALLLVWIFKGKMIGFDKWAEERKKHVADYRAQKKLKRIARRMA